MKVTKKMLERAEAEHYRKEDAPSLDKLHALTALYYKQRKQPKKAKAYMTGKEVKKLIVKYGKKKKVVKRVRKAPSSVLPISKNYTKIFRM
jgi:hypothetical protein